MQDRVVTLDGRGAGTALIDGDGDGDGDGYLGPSGGDFKQVTMHAGGN